MIKWINLNKANKQNYNPAGFATPPDRGPALLPLVDQSLAGEKHFVLTCPSCHLVHLVDQYLVGEHHLQFVQLGHHSTWTWPGFWKSVTIIISNHIFIPCPTWTSVSVNKNMNNHHQSIKNRTRNSKVQYHG